MANENGRCATFATLIAGTCEEGFGGAFPCCIVTTSTSMGPALVMAGLACAILLDLALATGAMRDNSAA